MKPQWLLRLYPRAWRERYGDELLALLEQTPPGVVASYDLVRAALGEWLRQPWLPDNAVPSRVRAIVGYYCALHMGTWALIVGIDGESVNSQLIWSVPSLILSAALQLRGAIVGVMLVYLAAALLSRVPPSTTRTRAIRWMRVPLFLMGIPLLIMLERAGVGPSREAVAVIWGSRTSMDAMAMLWVADWATRTVRPWLGEPQDEPTIA